ncbi:MAG: hypothetical protein KI792_12670 [Alphaproteobacteria bacterium]|nr:hypothetical protein [Alphaproteobacteria bacterium SS10]
MPRTQQQIDATDRLDEYNSNAYDETTNPRGMAQGGHRTNFPSALSDLELAADGVKVLADDADSLAGDAATAATNAGNSAAGAANAQTAAIMAQGGAELARQQAETIAAAAAQTVADAAALAGSGDFTGDVSVDGDVIIEGGLVEDIFFITGADTIGTAHSYMIYGNTQCTMSDDTVIGREWQIAGRWPDTVEPSDQAVTIVAAGADSFVARQDNKRVIDTDFIIETDGANTFRRIRSDLILVE